MSQAPPRSPPRSRQSYRHEALLWNDAREFTSALEPFIAEGLNAGEPVMVALIREHASWLRSSLGAEARKVKFVDMGMLGRNPARIIPAWQQFLNDHAAEGRPVRGIGEPIWAGRRPEEILECQLHEALLNVAVDPKTPFWLVCPYDVRGLDGDVIEEAHRSHLTVMEGSRSRGHSLYGGRTHVDAMFGAELCPLPAEAGQSVFTSEDVESVFGIVTLDAYAAGLASDRIADLAGTVRRLAVASLGRGAPQGTLRIWHSPHALVCEVADETLLDDVLVGRRAVQADGADALWQANKQCDLVQVRSGRDGTTVRLHMWK